MSYKHIAIKSAEEVLLESQIHMRWSLALLANAIGFPFVYTPIKPVPCIAKSEFEPEVLNRKWEEFFRQVTNEFVRMDDLDGEVFLLEYGPHTSRGLFRFSTDSPFKDSLFLSRDCRKKLAQVDGFSSEFYGPIKKSFVREFIRKSHRAYTGTFATDTRVSFENDVLQAVFIMHEDGGLRSPFLYDRLIPLLDFVEECALELGCRLQLHLLTSFELDQAMPGCWAMHKARALEEACSRPYVRLHRSLSFEEMMKISIGADLTWVSDTFYGRNILRGLLNLVSRPQQISIEMLPDASKLPSNSCFLAWDEGMLFYEKRKMLEALGTARRGSHRRDVTSRRDKKDILSSKRQSGGNCLNVSSGVIDGVGSCFAKVFMLQLIADYYGLQYVHVPRMSIDHNYKADPDWGRKWEEFFMFGEGRPGLREVFGGKSPDVYYSYFLPSSDDLNALGLLSDSLVVSNMAVLETWPLPDDYLSQKLVQARTAFHERHRRKEDCFDSGVVNVAVHVRAVDDYLPTVKRAFRTVAHIGPQFDLNAYADRIRVFHTTMRQLGMPFKLHIYSDARRRDLEPLLEFGDVRLCLSEEQDDWRVHCLEMSRADIFLPGYSRISYTAAILARPSQLQLVTNCLEGDLVRLLLCGGNAFYRESIDVLNNIELLEGFLDRHF